MASCKKTLGRCDSGLFLTFSERSTDVIHLSSSEDDPIVSSKATKAEESQPSGAHTDDAFNHPDAQSRVLVNVNHPSEEEDIFLSSQLARAVKPHQVLAPTPPKSSSVDGANVFTAFSLPDRRDPFPVRQLDRVGGALRQQQRIRLYPGPQHGPRQDAAGHLLHRHPVPTHPGSHCSRHRTCKPPSLPP